MDSCCPICFETLSEKLEQASDVGVITLSCSHVFCSSCLVQYVQTQLLEGKVTKITCLDGSCKTPISSLDLQNLIPPELHQKYQEFLAAFLLRTNPNVRHCPKKGCGAVNFITPGQTTVVCGENTSDPSTPTTEAITLGTNSPNTASPTATTTPSKTNDTKPTTGAGCGFAFCCKCGQAAHPRRSSCKLDKDEKKKQKYLKTHAKNCPRCEVPIEKNGGCHNVSCKCGCNFCWGCGQDYVTLAGRTHCVDKKIGGVALLTLLLGASLGLFFPLYCMAIPFAFSSYHVGVRLPKPLRKVGLNVLESLMNNSLGVFFDERY
eukprot:TRINITY_DN2219_c0_g1_i2.p1 TRINITY_DN2219_c0_g1~~TRINITY_DN2219_c0_g1_i2.p1  ORF type:complete len:319 (-),score=50.94 TRINITY_DN2219_c0_g1_i2:270-1226(-)